MKPTDEQVHDALKTIMDNQTSKALNYAVVYAAVGVHMIGEDLCLQCLYILSNMAHWRGEDATKVRQVLKAYTKR